MLNDVSSNSTENGPAPAGGMVFEALKATTYSPTVLGIVMKPMIEEKMPYGGHSISSYFHNSTQPNGLVKELFDIYTTL